jgi:N utilization substance protein A
MSEITNAIKQICEEKGLSYEAVIATIESALAAAYRKDYGEKNQNIKVEFDPETAATKVYDLKTVVEDLPELPEAPAEGEATAAADTEPAGVLTEEQEAEIHRFNPKTEIQLSEAKALNKKYQIGDEIRTELPAKDEYGRMAAQTAKQVIIQRLREAERDMVLAEFKDKEHEVITGVVQRREGRVILVDLGKTVGLILPEDQIRSERYSTGNRLKVYVKEVNSTPRGPEILLSRAADEVLQKVFYLEIPEISNGLIEVKTVAREAGSRAKVAVAALSDNIDPIGSCVGQRGARIQTIIREVGGEKIDIIEYSDQAEEFIANALSPAKIEAVELDEAAHKATVKVAADQLSLAIGKSGQNVRLAAHLTGWKIDIIDAEAQEVKASSDDAAVAAKAAEVAESVVPATAEEPATEPEIVETAEPKVKKTRKPRAKKVEPAAEVPEEIKDENETKSKE